jgi:hypothetical protein
MDNQPQNSKVGTETDNKPEKSKVGTETDEHIEVQQTYFKAGGDGRKSSPTVVWLTKLPYGHITIWPYYR